MRAAYFAIAAAVLITSCVSAAPAADWSADGPAPRVTIGTVTPVLPPAPHAARDARNGLYLSFVGVGVDPEGDTASELAFTPDGSKIVVAHRDSKNLVVFDAATRQVLNVVPLSGSPNSLALSSLGTYAVTAKSSRTRRRSWT